ncbi:SprT family zinc-dependent metalloprotease [Paenibacillus oryzisoli]|uniref:M48 family metallopeptidase n=1 Tax=Paenibacillus oryzisoli TaxID=1850517 RepID=UPI003D27F2DE
MNIEFENQEITFHVSYGNSAKLSIHMDGTGFITVKAPKGTSEAAVKEAVRQHGRVILQRLQRLGALREAFQPKAYDEEGKFLHLGKSYLLHELIDTEGLDEEALKLRLKKFYFASCKKVIAERLPIYQDQLKVRPKSFEIEESATKWGTCSSDKKLTFNYRLAMAPIEVIDYVVVHELCHLLHMNHDRSFWRRVGGIMPDYKEKEAYLARYGGAMTL